jgi:hypothetical protein
MPSASLTRCTPAKCGSCQPAFASATGQRDWPVRAWPTGMPGWPAGYSGLALAGRWAGRDRAAYWSWLLVVLVVVARCPSGARPQLPRPPPPPPRSSGRCHPRRSMPAAGVGPRPRPRCLGQRLRGMLGLVAPHDHGDEGRLLLPPAAHRDSEHGPGDPGLGVADLGLVGEVAGEADRCLGHGPAPPCCLAGRAALPLDPGTVDTEACRETFSGKR